MKTETTQTGAGNTTAAHFVIKYVAHPTYDPTEREATFSDDCAFSNDQIAARFVTRHGGSVISVLRWDDDRGIWVGPEKTKTTAAAQPIDAAHAIYCDHDYNTGPLVCYVHDIREAALIAEALGATPLDIAHALDMRALTRTSDVVNAEVIHAA